MNRYRKMVVFFVDLLGTKANKDFDDKLLIHRLFHKEIEESAERTPPHVAYGRTVFSFSDCAYILYYYKDDQEHSEEDDMALLEVAMRNTSFSLALILNSGHLVRGGIAVGDAYFDEFGCFGPAVEKAYLLESTRADMPIVILEDELGRNFVEWAERADTRKEQYFKALLEGIFDKELPQLVERGERGEYFLNAFYHLEMTSIAKGDGNESYTLNTVRDNIKSAIAAWRTALPSSPVNEVKKTPVRSTPQDKWNWMESYLETKELKTSFSSFSISLK